MIDSDRGPVTRRTLLRGTAGGLATGLALGGVGSATAQTGVDDWLADTDNYDGTVEDRRGQDEVRIDVGAGSGFLFGPAAVRVDPGTTVVWEWTGSGGQHNVHAMDGADFQSETTQEEGFTYEQTLSSEGVVTYQCDPHATVGMKGVLVVGDVQVGSSDVQPDWGDWFTDQASGGAVANYEGTTEDLRGQDEVTIGVGTQGNGGNFGFGPPAVWIDPGTTVRFEWTGKGGDHNVVSEAGPAELDSGEALEEAGVHYEYTFEESGIYTYYCDPHLTLGMKGAIAVGSVPTVELDAAEPAAPEEGGGGFALPVGDVEIALGAAWFGIMGLAAVAILTGELRELLAVEESTAETEIAEPDAGIVREVTHEEFQPVGTAALIAVYFLILVGLWVFMYFVEFLGNGPTVIG